jgi:hypothetical protein
MTRTLLMVAAAAAMLAPAAAAQAPAGPAERIAAAQARVAAAGVPAELLQNLVNEGRAKGVPMDRVAAAAERRAAALERAAGALERSDRRTSAAEFAAGADAIEAGVDGRGLQAVIQAARGEDGSVALAVLAELARQGMPVENALERVTAAMARGGDALANLPAKAAEARERRGAPASAGRPAEAGRPGTAGRPGGTGGPPAGVPAGGNRPGGGGPPSGTPGGRP